MDTINILESISVIVASLVASGTVIYGINAWRREYIGKKKLELAEDVLALFYEARDAIRFIRNPFSYGGEGSTRNSTSGETPEEKQINDNAYVAFERYNKRQDLFNKIYSIRYRYMASFGKESARPFDELNKIVNEIFISARMLPIYWSAQGHRQWSSDSEFKKHLEEMHKHESIFWEMKKEDDPITPRLDGLISEIESQTSKIIGIGNKLRFFEKSASNKESSKKTKGEKLLTRVEGV